MLSGLNAEVPRSRFAAGSPGTMRNRKKLKATTKTRVRDACAILPIRYRRIQTPVSG
jgi:hypothetical protein